MRFRIIVDGEERDIEVDGQPPVATIRVDGVSYRVRTAQASGEFHVRVGRGLHRVTIRGNQVLVDGAAHEVAAVGEAASMGRASEGGTTRTAGLLEIRPPMPGRVVKVPIAAGDRVKRGQTLVVLEAMKMQNEIPAPADGVVRSVSVHPGESIPGDRVIAMLETH